MSGFSGRAWESAWCLLAEYPHRLTLAQQITCQLGVMAGPDRAPLEIIAMACQIIGDRK